jgi:hypothetical protein
MKGKWNKNIKGLSKNLFKKAKIKPPPTMAIQTLAQMNSEFGNIVSQPVYRSKTLFGKMASFFDFSMPSVSRHDDDDDDDEDENLFGDEFETWRAENGSPPIDDEDDDDSFDEDYHKFVLQLIEDCTKAGVDYAKTLEGNVAHSEKASRSLGIMSEAGTKSTGPEAFETVAQNQFEIMAKDALERHKFLLAQEKTLLKVQQSLDQMSPNELLLFKKNPEKFVRERTVFTFRKRSSDPVIDIKSD